MKRSVPVCQSLRDAMIMGFCARAKNTLTESNLRYFLETIQKMARCRGSECSNWMYLNYGREGRCRKHDIDNASKDTWVNREDKVDPSTVIPEKEEESQ